MPTLYYDVTELYKFDKKTGIQRVTRAILRELSIDVPQGWRIVPVVGDGRQGNFFPVFLDFFSGGATGRLEAGPVELVAGDFFVSVDLAYNITTGLRERLRDFRSVGARVIFVLYDLIPVRHPEWFYGANDWFEGNDYLNLFSNWLDCLVGEADGVVCISNAVRTDFFNWLAENGICKPSTFCSHFHLGSDLAASAPTVGLPPGALQLISDIAQVPTFLIVGTVEPRKGHHLALEACDELWASGLEFNLVIVGRQGWKVDALVERIKQHGKYGSSLHWLDGISDEFLINLYENSHALLALSEDEGFGLPIVEARYYGLAILASDIPVFREVAGEWATFLENRTPVVLAEAIRQSVLDRSSKAAARNLKDAPLSWKDSAAEFVEAIRYTACAPGFWSE